jgi:hypothetical protein
MLAIEMQQRLQRLEAERAMAGHVGLHEPHAYLAELDDEIAVARDAYVGAAVTEIAILRAELSGPQLG